MTITSAYLYTIKQFVDKSFINSNCIFYVFECETFCSNEKQQIRQTTENK